MDANGSDSVGLSVLLNLNRVLETVLQDQVWSVLVFKRVFTPLQIPPCPNCHGLTPLTSVAKACDHNDGHISPFPMISSRSVAMLRLPNYHKDTERFSCSS